MLNKPIEDSIHQTTWIGKMFETAISTDSEILAKKKVVVDYGCGNGNIGFKCLDTNPDLETLIFVDVDQNALKQCESMAREKNIHNKCVFLNAHDTKFEEYIQAYPIDLVIGNMPENPQQEICGVDGQAIQKEFLSRIFNTLNCTPDAKVLLKAVSYSENSPLVKLPKKYIYGYNHGPDPREIHKGGEVQTILFQIPVQEKIKKILEI